MSTISFSGLATGMDTASIVSQLLELKRAPVYRLQNDRQTYQSQISALGTLKDKLLALQTAAQGLDTANEFAALKATSSHEDLLQVTASSSAAPGTFSVEVQALAAAQKSRSQMYTSTATTIGTGTYRFTVGGEEQTLEIDTYTDLATLAERINNEIDGINAAIIYDGSDTGGYYLSLTGEPGSSGAFSIDTSGLNGGSPPVLTTIQAAADAHLVIDGLDVYTDGNTVENAISGLSINLLGAEVGTRVQIDVATDADGVKEQVKGFVDAYNDVILFLELGLKTDGNLHGNTTARSIMNSMQSVMNASHSGDGAYSLLAQVGIEHQQGTRALKFDESKFADAVAADFSAVRDLFIERDGNIGKASLIDTAVDNLTDSISGMFKMGTDSLNTRIENIDNSIERYERSIESYRITLERKFVAMEQMVAQLQAQGNSLMSMSFTSYNQSS
ncbi:MAG: flagellar filament capping protein FliD [Candidatus Krumholzibacteriia bacterium]